MADIGTAVSFMVAVVELAQVKSVRKAIKTNLIAAGGIEGPLGNIEMPKPLGPRTRELVAQPGYSVEEPRRQRVSPCTATPIVRTVTIVQPADPVRPADVIEPLPAEPHRHREHGPLVAPWNLPLVPSESCGRTIVKLPPPPPDLVTKGMLLDFFM